MAQPRNSRKNISKKPSKPSPGYLKRGMVKPRDCIGRRASLHWAVMPALSPDNIPSLSKIIFYIEDDEEGQDVAVGNLIFAGEHVSDEFQGFMNGAAQTGRLAAQYLLSRLANYEL